MLTSYPLPTKKIYQELLKTIQHRESTIFKAGPMLQLSEFES